jgi:hypothetical protein
MSTSNNGSAEAVARQRDAFIDQSLGFASGTFNFSPFILGTGWAFTGP